MTKERKDEMEQQEISQEEMQEICELYKDRLDAPQEVFIKYESPEQLYEMLMEHKKKHGWKFKGEK